jgi:DNA processing protein
MKYSPDIESWLSLSLISGLGDESVRRLLVTFGSPDEIFSASVGALERVVKKRVARNILCGADKIKLAAALKWLEDPANSIITLADPDYPKLLLNISDPPPLLYFICAT